MKFKRSKIEKAMQDINKALKILKSESGDDKLTDPAINEFSKPLKHFEDKVKQINRTLKFVSGEQNKILDFIQPKDRRAVFQKVKNSLISPSFSKQFALCLNRSHQFLSISYLLHLFYFAISMYYPWNICKCFSTVCQTNYT